MHQESECGDTDPVDDIGKVSSVERRGEMDSSREQDCGLEEKRTQGASYAAHYAQTTSGSRVTRNRGLGG